MTDSKTSRGFLLGLGLIAVLFIIINSHALLDRGRYVKPANPELFAQWKAQPYSSISPNTLQTISSRVRTEASKSGWTEEQESKLAESVEKMLFAFSTGRYEDYERFRFPIKEVKFDPARIADLVTGLRENDPKFT